MSNPLMVTRQSLLEINCLTTVEIKSYGRAITTCLRRVVLRSIFPAECTEKELVARVRGRRWRQLSRGITRLSAETRVVCCSVAGQGRRIPWVPESRALRRGGRILGCRGVSVVSKLSGKLRLRVRIGRRGSASTRRNRSPEERLTLQLFPILQILSYIHRNARQNLLHIPTELYRLS